MYRTPARGIAVTAIAIALTFGGAVGTAHAIDPRDQARDCVNEAAEEVCVEIIPQGLDRDE